MFRFAVAAAFAFSLLSGAASAQAVQSLNINQALTRPDLLILTEVLRPREGEVRIVTGAIAPGTVFLSIPVAHRRTIVVNQDLGEGAGILVSPRVLVNGARGYWSGNFSPFQQVQGEAVWCFLDERQERPRSLCLAPRINAHAPAARSRNLYLAQQLEVSTDENDHWDTPLVTERPVAIHDDLRIEYVFRGWRGRDVQIEIRVGGAEYEDRRIRVLNDRLVLPSAVGNFTLVRSARDAIVTLAQAEAPAASAPSMLGLYDPNRRPIPVLVARSAVQPDAAMRRVAPGADLFMQDVAPAGAVMIDRSPARADERSPQALGPFSTFRSNGHDIICNLNRRPNPRDVTFFRLPNGMRAVKSWDFCLEDVDGEPGFEAMHNFLGYSDETNIGVWWTTGQGAIDEVIEASETQFDWPSETIRLRYITSTDERQTPDGLRPAVAVFAIVLGNSDRLQPDWWLLPVQLDAEGRGELRLSGRVVARVERVALDGSAQVQVIGGIADGVAPLLDPADFASARDVNARHLGQQQPTPVVPFVFQQ